MCNGVTKPECEPVLRELEARICGLSERTNRLSEETSECTEDMVEELVELMIGKGMITAEMWAERKRQRSSATPTLN